MLRSIVVAFVMSISFSFALGVVYPTEIQAKKLTPAEKQAKKDKRYLSFMNKNIKSIKHLITKNSWISADRGIKNATKYYNKISDDSKQSADVLAAKKELDALEQKISAQLKADDEERTFKRDMLDQKVAFSSAIRPYMYSLYRLNDGKQKQVGSNSLTSIDKLKQGYAALEAFAAEYPQKFAMLLKEAPDYKYEGVSAAEVDELLKNRLQYRDTFVLLVCEKELQQVLDGRKRVLSRIEKEQIIDYVHFSDYYGQKAKAAFAHVTRVVPYYGWIGKKPPQKLLDTIAGYKNTIRAALNKVAAQNRWQQKKYAYRNKAMAEAAADLAKRYEMKLVKVGMRSNNKWHINKNGLGIPLSKTGEGYVILQKQGEPFKRGYKASFKRVFNGQGYEPISSVSLSRYVTPHK